MGKNFHWKSADLPGDLVLIRRPQLTKLEQVICQRVPSESLKCSENTAVLEQRDPQPSAIALLQLRSELVRDGLIK
jgi:hypothetical protein